MTHRTQKLLNSTGAIYVIGAVVFASIWLTSLFARNRVRATK